VLDRQVECKTDETGNFSLELFAGSFVSILELPRDLVRSAPCFLEVLPLLLQLPIQGDGLVDIGVGITIEHVLPDEIDIVENESDIKHDLYP